MPYCTNCGHDVGDGDSHCPNCGEEVRQRSSNRFGRVSGVGGAPLPRDTKNAFVGILIGIVVFGGLQVGLSYWLGLFDVIDNKVVAAASAYVFNVILDIVVIAGGGFVLAKANPLFKSGSPSAGLSPQSKNAFLGVVVGNTVLTAFSYMGRSGEVRESLASGSLLVLDLSSFLLFPAGVILCGYVFSKREVI